MDALVKAVKADSKYEDDGLRVVVDDPVKIAVSKAIMAVNALGFAPRAL